MANEPQGLSRSRKLLRPMDDMKVDAVLGARQGQLAASSSLQWLCPFYSVLSFCSASAAQTEQQVKDHQQTGRHQKVHWLLALCLTEPDPSSLMAPALLTPSPFQMALYFCTGVLEDETLFHHYALNVPFYTHFTSPIRRYADIVVHRLLSASLGECCSPAWLCAGDRAMALQHEGAWACYCHLSPLQVPHPPSGWRKRPSRNRQITAMTGRWLPRGCRSSAVTSSSPSLSG